MGRRARLRATEQAVRLDAREEAYQTALKAHKRQSKAAKAAAAEHTAGTETTAAGASVTTSSAAFVAQTRVPLPTVRYQKPVTAAMVRTVVPPPLDPALALPGQRNSQRLHATLVGQAICQLGQPPRKSLQELKSYTNPPAAVGQVLECLSVVRERAL